MTKKGEKMDVAKSEKCEAEKMYWAFFWLFFLNSGCYSQEECRQIARIFVETDFPGVNAMPSPDECWLRIKELDQDLVNYARSCPSGRTPVERHDAFLREVMAAIHPYSAKPHEVTASPDEKTSDQLRALRLAAGIYDVGYEEVFFSRFLLAYLTPKKHTAKSCYSNIKVYGPQPLSLDQIYRRIKDLEPCVVEYARSAARGKGQRDEKLEEVIRALIAPFFAECSKPRLTFLENR